MNIKERIKYFVEVVWEYLSDFIKLLLALALIVVMLFILHLFYIL